MKTRENDKAMLIRPPLLQRRLGLSRRRAADARLRRRHGGRRRRELRAGPLHRGRPATSTTRCRYRPERPRGGGRRRHGRRGGRQYLRLWGGSGVSVTLVERSASYTRTS